MNIINKYTLIVPLAVLALSVGPYNWQLLPPRDYVNEVVALRGDEAIAIRTATVALEDYLAAKAPGQSIRDFYCTVQVQHPSAWRVEWALNDATARGGIEVILDTTGTKVRSIRHVE